MQSKLALSVEEIAIFCKQHHIERLSLFGSILRDDFRPDSDVDILVEFSSEHIPGLIGLVGMQFELSDMLGREVDLRTPASLSRYFRQKILDTAEVVYERER